MKSGKSKFWFRSRRDCGSRTACGRCCAGGRARSGEGFTLVELLMVMTLLIVVIAISLPSLAGFFHGRSLDNEAQRMLAMTHHGQSRAASEGLPMVMWLDQQQRIYGLEADSTYADPDTKAEKFSLADNIKLQVPISSTVKAASGGAGDIQASASSQSAAVHRNLPQIRFLPDGSIDNTSVTSVQIEERDGTRLWLGLSRSGLNYEIRNQANP